MATIAQVMNEFISNLLNYFQISWDKFGWVFIFLVCGCNGVGDEVRLVDGGNENRVIEKLNMNLLL